MTRHTALIAVLTLMGALAVLTFVDLFGGPDPLGDARSLLYGITLLAWFTVELRSERTGTTRRILQFGIAAAVLMIAVTGVELLI
jgi:hypothetical protein